MLIPPAQEYVAGEIHIREQLYAMRHLRPGMQLPEPVGKRRQQLLVDLLHLTEETDPLAWLQRDRSSLCSRLALWWCIRYAGSITGSLRFADDTRALLGAPPVLREEPLYWAA